jgi:hypothetical protein
MRNESRILTVEGIKTRTTWDEEDWTKKMKVDLHLFGEFWHQMVLDVQTCHPDITVSINAYNHVDWQTKKEEVRRSFDASYRDKVLIVEYCTSDPKRTTYYSYRDDYGEFDHIRARDRDKTKNDVFYHAPEEEYDREKMIEAVKGWVKDVDKRAQRNKKAKKRRAQKKIDNATPDYYIVLALKEELKERGYTNVHEHSHYLYAEKNNLHFRMSVKGWKKGEDKGRIHFASLYDTQSHVGLIWIETHKIINMRAEDPNWNPQTIACNLIDTMERVQAFKKSLAKEGWEGWK